MGSLKRRGESYNQPRVKPSGSSPEDAVSGSDSGSESLWGAEGTTTPKKGTSAPKGKKGFSLNYVSDNSAELSGSPSDFLNDDKIDQTLGKMGIPEKEAGAIKEMFAMMNDLLEAYDRLLTEPNEKNIKTYKAMLEAAVSFPNTAVVESLLSAGIAAISVIRKAEGKQ